MWNIRSIKQIDANDIKGRTQPRLSCFFVSCLFVLMGTCSALSQSERKNERGLNELNAENMTLITDLEFDEELRAWPLYLSQSMRQWKEIFRPPDIKLQGLKPIVYLVGNKQQWYQQGWLNELPGLEDGYQYGDRLYIVEQPSVYYRRLLFLHEATHWIMSRWQGGAGAPWIMEGMADYLGTHRFLNETIELGWMPQSVEQVPKWGRLRLIQETIRSRTSPKLSEIFAFREMRTQRMERYSWSWAACTFFATHPELKQDFQAIYRGPLDYSLQSSQQLYETLRSRWDGLSVQWRAFVDDLDFGMDCSRSALELRGNDFRDLGSNEKISIRIQADRGWQSTGILVSKDTQIRIRSHGSFIVRKGGEADPWISESQGITVQYYRHHPLGCLVAAFAEIDGEQPSMEFERIRVGKESMLQARNKSLLLLRINESSDGLQDNVGELAVEISSD